MNTGLVIGLLGVVIIAGAYLLLTKNQYPYNYQVTPNIPISNQII